MTEYDPRAFIDSVEWTFASTMPDNPHWYVIRRSHGGPLFDAFVQAIKEHGTKRLYEGWKYRTIVVDQFTYWLTWAGGAGQCISRKPTAEAGWDDEEQERGALAQNGVG